MNAQRITPCLWFDFNAEEAVAHYLTVFGDGRIVSIARYGESGPGPKDAAMTILFEIRGQRILALNGGPQFSFTPAVSLIVDCDGQDDVDRLWDGLSDGGKPGRCGWLADRFGVSWQIVPNVVPTIMQSGDAAGIARAMRAILPMTKLDVATIERAFAGA